MAFRRRILRPAVHAAVIAAVWVAAAIFCAVITFIKWLEEDPDESRRVRPDQPAVREAG